MKFYRPDNLPPANRHWVTCRESRWKKAGFVSACLAVMTFFIFNAATGGNHGFPILPSLYLAGATGLMGGIALWYLLATFRASNWLLHLSPEGIYVKFRSHLNEHLTVNSPIVVFFPYHDIRWVRKRWERVTSMSGINAKPGWSFVTSLDLKISQTDRSTLGKALKEERETLSTMKKKGVHNHYPLSVAENDIVRIEWKSPATCTTPSITKVLALLAKKVAVEKGIRIFEKEIYELTREEAEERVLDFVQRGRLLDAVKILRYTHGYSLVEAKNIIDDLFPSADRKNDLA